MKEQKLSFSLKINGIEEVQNGLKEIIEGFERIKDLEARFNNTELSMVMDASNMSMVLEEPKEDEVVPQEQQSIDFDECKEEYAKLCDLREIAGVTATNSLTYRCDQLGISTFLVEKEISPNNRGYLAIATSDVKKLLNWKSKTNSKEKEHDNLDAYLIDENAPYLDECQGWVNLLNVMRIVNKDAKKVYNFHRTCEKNGIETKLFFISRENHNKAVGVPSDSVPKVIELYKKGYRK